MGSGGSKCARSGINRESKCPNSSALGTPSHSHPPLRYIANMVSILDLYAQKIIRDSHVPLERAPRGIPSLPDLEQEHVTYDDAQKEQEQLSIGIIGAGAAGLFIGMTLEKVNNYLLGRGVKPVNFEILEAESANGEHPIGGRLWTYQFSKSANDYYVRLLLCSSTASLH